MNNPTTAVRALIVLGLLLVCLAPAQNQGLSMLTSGVDGYVDVPGSPTLEPAGGVTIEAWISYDDSTVPVSPSVWVWPTIFRKNSTGGLEEFMLRVNAANNGSRTLYWKVRTTGGSSSISWSFAPGQLLPWTHVAATYDNSQLRLFVNGAEVASGAGSGSLLYSTPSAPLTLGTGAHIPPGQLEIWNGGLDEVRFWSYARTETDIQTTMLQTISTASGLEASWHLDGDALDASGNGNHGTVAGVANYIPVTWPVEDWETNDDDGAVDINGEWGSIFNPSVINLNAFLCTPPSPASGTLNIGTVNNASGFWDLAISNQNVVPLSGAGLMLGTEMFNLSVVSTITFLNGGPILGLSPFVGASFPGVLGSSLSVNFTLSTATDLGLQGVVTAPAAPTGFVLTQPTELHVAVTGAATSVPGPTTDDGPLSVSLTTAPFCPLSGGLDFFGTSYTSMQVDPNGRIHFGSAVPDFSPTVLEMTTGSPNVSVWSDFNPASGGSVTVSSTAPGVVRIDWTNVPYIGQANANSFGIEFDTNVPAGNQAVVIIDNLSTAGVSNLLPGPPANMLIGISPGLVGGATDPLFNTTFTVGGSGAVATPTDITYDFLDATLTPGSLPGSLLSGTGTPVQQILFVDDGVGNYVWSGF